MVSKVKVDSLETTAGTGTIALNNQLSGMTVSSLPTTGSPPGIFAGGKVLQVVSSTSTAYVTMTSTTYLATGLSASITPASTSSKIFVQVTGSLDTNNPDYIIECQIYKDGSSDVGKLTATYDHGGRLIESCAFNHMSSPATTSSTTYEVYFRTPGSGNEVRWNSQNVVCSMVLMEIAG